MTMLTTVARASVAMGKELNHEEEKALEQAIAAVSASIERYCGLVFALNKYQYKLKGPGSQVLNVQHTPVHTAEIKISGKVLDGIHYTIKAETGALVHETAWPDASKTIQVNYSAGYVLPHDDNNHTTLPREIELACILYVQELLNSLEWASWKPEELTSRFVAATAGPLPLSVAALLRM